MQMLIFAFKKGYFYAFLVSSPDIYYSECYEIYS
jgi:hypothetical protein